MTPNAIFTAVRMAPEIADMDAAKYSDYDLINVFNSVVDAIYTMLANRSGRLIEKRATLGAGEDGYKLPDDFLQMVVAYNNQGRVMDYKGKGRELTAYTYYIVGQKLYTKSKSVTIEYKPYFVEATTDTLDNDMDLPAYFKGVIKKAIVLLLTASTAEQEQTVFQTLADEVQRLVSDAAFAEVPSIPTWAEVI